MKPFLVIIISFIALFFLPISFASEYCTVEIVVDGDTVDLDGEERVRLIGVDTPELHHSEKPVMYLAKESYKFLKNLCLGKKVRLEYEEVNAHHRHKDKYGRTLAYLYLEDGTFINAEIIKQGYGFCYTKYPFKYMDKFRLYQREARQDSKGLWNEEETIYNPGTSNIIMLYKKLNKEGQETARDFMEFLSAKSKYSKEEEE